MNNVLNDHRRRKNEIILQATLQIQQNQLATELTNHETQIRAARKRAWGGRSVGNARNIRRDKSNWGKDDLITSTNMSTLYPERCFRRIFGIPRVLFNRIKRRLVTTQPYNLMYPPSLYRNGWN